jgi:hypothetical protein
MDSITKYSMESSQQDNGTPQIRIGKEANLDFFQSLVNNNNDKMMMNPTCHFQQSLPDDNDEALLLPEAMSVKVTLQATQTDSTSLVQEFKDIPGTLFITTERLVFVSSKDDNNKNDFSIHAACLLLHAISQDGLYIQVQDVNEEKDGFELTITPTTTPTTTTTLQQQQQQQVMFDALTKLVSLHPIMDNDDNDDEDFGFFNDNAVMAPPRTAREEMLQRLDEMLVVVEVPPPPPPSECYPVVVQGQFDDAHEPPQEEQQYDDDDNMNASNNNNNDDEELL